MIKTLMFVAALMFAALASGCDSSAVPASPAQYEQAKADCAPHGGLESVQLVLVLLRPDRVDAICKSGVRLAREA